MIEVNQVYIYALLVLGIGMLLGTLWMLRKTVSVQRVVPLPEPPHSVPEAPPASLHRGVIAGPIENPVSEAELEALQRSRDLIRGLLTGVSNNVRTLMDEMDAYGDSLKRHEGTVQKAQTLAALQEVEHLLLTEISGMRLSTEVYRDKLDEANQTIAEQRNEMERLSHEASLDFLTRLANRRALDKRMIEELNRATRKKSPLSVVLFDVDRFKSINDNHGHLCGDEVLRLIANCLATNCRDYDFIARYGGEEFAMLLPDTAMEEAGAVAGKLRALIASTRWRVLDVELPITISGGVTQMKAAGDSPSEIFERADRALYQAKNAGRNRVIMKP